jgi:hypothetical protein
MSWDLTKISIYFNIERIIIIGSFNDPHGPRIDCGIPIVLSLDATANEIGAALKKIHDISESFTEKDKKETLIKPYTAGSGIKSWSSFAKKYNMIAVGWWRDNTVEFEVQKKYSDNSFGPSAKPLLRKLHYSGNNEEIGNVILRMIE